MTKPNAQFIVKSCNNHDVLVEALKKAKSALETANNFNRSDDIVDMSDECFYAIKEIEQALKKIGS